MLEEVSVTVEEEVKKAESFPRPTLEDCFRHTYATMPDDLREALEALRKEQPTGRE